MPYLTTQQVQRIAQSRQAGYGAGAADDPKAAAENARMQCQHNIVKQQVEEMYRATPGRNTGEDDFYEYQIDVSTVLFQGTYSSIYLASHNNDPDCPMVARVYEPTTKIDPQRSSYMKILKHIGRRSAESIATWDIFFDDANRIVIFQEFALLGNLKDYLKEHNVYVPEDQLHEWAGQVYKALDFLGDSGICHRGINPKHILLTTAPDMADKTVAKLGSFRDAMIYFDPLQGRVRGVPCREKRDSPGANFQAPEVFEKKSSAEKKKDDKEAPKEPKDEPTEFDPVSADIWSYGATFFFVNARYYPVKHASNDHGVDPSATIAKSIAYAKNLSPEAKDWFTGLLKADPVQRTPFEKIATHPWFLQGPSNWQG